MPRNPLSIRFNEDLLREIDKQVADTWPRPSRIAVIHHMLWQSILLRRNLDRAAERLYRMREPKGVPWSAVPDNSKQDYQDVARQMIEDMSRP